MDLRLEGETLREFEARMDRYNELRKVKMFIWECSICDPLFFKTKEKALKHLEKYPEHKVHEWVTKPKEYIPD